MRARTGLGVVAVWAVVSAVAPTGSQAVENEVERGQFALAGWASIDEETGEEHFRMLIANASVGGIGEIFFDTWDAYPVRCPDGEEGVRIVEGGGAGGGSFVVRRNLSGATLEGVVDVETTTRVICESAEEPSVRRTANLPVSFDLTGVGPRWRESGGNFQRIPGLVNSHVRSVAIGRDAVGTFTVGEGSYPLVFGDFGRVSGKWHYSERIGMAATRMRTLLPVGALAPPSSTGTGAITRAGAVWERTRGERYRGIFVGADRPRSGETLVYLETYASRPITCPDGSVAFRERLQYGEASGTLVVGGHNRSAVAEAVMDVLTVVVNGCTGATRSWVRHDVAVGLDLTGSGPVFRGGEWSGIHVPGESNDRVWVSWEGRSAGGTIRIGSVLYRPTAWAEIGTLRWREHFQAVGE